ncbi:hypothetical protein L3X38_036884 [Prunus dulcis]|uniref:Uncharacterized protein n=1 Tax=Prunus dulcis TaxID=3755 RepID=A0AAD4V4D3_PRUDU|nr:hypothetical protein L3X38_036884 [Prunus dulcis]
MGFQLQDWLFWGCYQDSAIHSFSTYFYFLGPGRLQGSHDIGLGQLQFLQPKLLSKLDKSVKLSLPLVRLFQLPIVGGGILPLGPSRLNLARRYWGSFGSWLLYHWPALVFGTLKVETPLPSIGRGLYT